jgi:hypothetical protein
MNLIGVSGRKRHGKDTFAARLVERHGFTRVAFADPMREMALALDPIISDGWRLAALVETFGWEEAKANPEVRRTLQRLGTEAGRGVLGDNIWVDTAMRYARSLGGRVVFTDCRFPNEADAIRDAGGQIIRVNRPAFPDDGDPHPSETALDRYPFDDLVLNDGTVDDLHAIADSIAAEL